MQNKLFLNVGALSCSELPFVDAVVGFESYSQLGAQVERILATGTASTSALEQNVLVGTPHVPFRVESERRRITAQHTAYLRVAEGCDHTCTFCSIPGFRGKFRSKRFEAVVAEANLLAASGGLLNLFASRPKMRLSFFQSLEVKTMAGLQTCSKNSRRQQQKGSENDKPGTLRSSARNAWHRRTHQTKRTRKWPTQNFEDYVRNAPGAATASSFCLNL